MAGEPGDAASVADAEMGSVLISEPYEMRITDHGKIHSFVSFALKFLQENPQRPLVLHTLPSIKHSQILKKNANAQPETMAQPEPDTNPVEEVPDGKPAKMKSKVARLTTTIPKLVSVVEIIKREYGKWASTRQAPEGGLPNDYLRLGLHQYNELTTLEDLGFVVPQELTPDDAGQLWEALGGKNFLKQKFTPHLKVTLSVGIQPMLEERGATHQPPPPIKKSKSARARERQRQKRKEARKVIAV